MVVNFWNGTKKNIFVCIILTWQFLTAHFYGKHLPDSEFLYTYEILFITTDSRKRECNTIFKRIFKS